MISVAIYQVRCDEPGCREDIHFIARMHRDLLGVYEITPEIANAGYVFWGGEITPEGKHRCKACRERINGKLASPSPKEINQQCDAMRDARSTLPAIAEIIKAARAYRAAEQDGTPRLWRGRELQELAAVLDDALDKFDASASAGRVPAAETAVDG